MTIDTSLLDLDRSPTMEELRSFFKKHDWSSAKLSDPKNRSAEKKADMNKVRKIMDAEFEKISREKGLGASSIYFENKITVQDDNGEPIVQHQGNPLLELRDNVEDLVSDAVYEIVTNHDDIMDTVFSRFDLSDPDLENKADELLHNAVGTMMDVTNYEKVAKIVHDMSDYDDFNQNIHPNFRAEDHEKRWNHTDTKHPTLPDPDIEQKIHSQNPGTEAQAIANIMAEEYWKSLDKKDRVIVKMLMAGYTQTEISKELGFSGNSGIFKRIEKLKKGFSKATGIKIDD